MKVLFKTIVRSIYNFFVVLLAMALIGGGIAALANYQGTQGTGTTFASIVISSAHYAAFLLCDPSAGQSQCATVDSGGNAHVLPGASGDIIVNPSSNFTRPANTTTYATGQLVANSTTAGSVAPLSWTAARVSAGNFRITRTRMSLSSKSVTSTSFRVHYFNASTAVQNGDGATFDPTTLADEVCEMDVTISLAGNDVSLGYGAPNQGVSCDVALGSGSTLYGLVEARAAYGPGSGETITVIPEIHQN